MNDAPTDPRARARERSEQKAQFVRDQLVPLAPGERPKQVTIAAIVAMLLAVSNLVAYFASFDPKSADIPQLALITGVLVAAAVGMWLVRYWAVLGFQTLLALQIIVLVLASTRANSGWVILLFTVFVIASGALFWSLVKAMARIQMPEAPEVAKLRKELEDRAEVPEPDEQDDRG
jgi:hypothetical protein